MNKRLLTTAMAVLFGSGLLGALQGFQQPEWKQPGQHAVDTNAPHYLDYAWQQAISSIPQFSPPEAEKPAQQEEHPLQAVTIEDSLLIALVTDNPSSILIQAPDSSNPQSLQLGESWLADWVLHEIGKDFVVWHNTASDQFYTQFLFGVPTEANVESNNS
ncbi:hypothetical protein [Bowmanella denitrificans]|uniref:hypothetical protein n=1 Tax=Bowmanella denitrificans TaxID=366582 RepID=UPI000C9A6D78|nr:hypothetical protein [Bowmanella denitrificans]